MVAGWVEMVSADATSEEVESLAADDAEVPSMVAKNEFDEASEKTESIDSAGFSTAADGETEIGGAPDANAGRDRPGIGIFGMP